VGNQNVNGLCYNSKKSERLRIGLVHEGKDEHAREAGDHEGEGSRGRRVPAALARNRRFFVLFMTPMPVAAGLNPHPRLVQLGWPAIVIESMQRGLRVLRHEASVMDNLAKAQMKIDTCVRLVLTSGLVHGARCCCTSCRTQPPPGPHPTTRLHPPCTFCNTVVPKPMAQKAHVHAPHPFPA
jgi:hypothetical protein